MANYSAVDAQSTTYSRTGMHIPENFSAVVARGLDEVFKRALDEPMEGKPLYRTYPMKQRTITFQSHYGLGTVEQNRDADELPYDEKGLGFQFTLTANTYRGAIKIEQELVEDELYGVIRDLQSELSASYMRAQEYVLVDLFNRGIGDAYGTSPLLCEDGYFFIDEDRPNPFHKAQDWSNKESAGAITPTSLYNVQLNFAAYKNERDLLSPMTLKQILCRPTDEKTLWEIVQSDMRPTDAMNAKNFQYGRFQYTVMNRLTSAYIYYYAGDSFQDSRNELYFGDRISPELSTWTDGDNPNVTNQSIRGRYGIACGRPYMWRANVVS